MKINTQFNAYGHIGCCQSMGDQRPHTAPLALTKLSKEIEKNAAIIAALLAITDQEEKERKKKHRFQFLNKKQQVKVLLSNLHNIQFNFCTHVQSNKKKESEHKRKVLVISKNNQSKQFRIGCSAARAIAQAAESWVVARHTELLEVAASLFFATKNDHKN